MESRRHQRIKRRVYNVKGPHHLWHLDGNHKLKDFHLVIHGCIDGFSRNVIYLRVIDNNNANTVLDYFVQGTRNYMIPSRIRIDKGGENVRVAEYMLIHRGTGRSSVIAGRSVHNQRIERLWRDVRVNVIDFYRTIFYAFATEYNVDFSDEHVVYCIHYLYLGMIQEDLNIFTVSWNKHGLRTTTGNRSPEQLLILNEHLTADAPDDVDDEYGVEEESANDDIGQVVLHPVNCPLNAEQKARFINSVSPVTRSAVNIYRRDHFHDVEVEQSFVQCMYGLYLEGRRHFLHALLIN